eukprot:TRINITY_DN92128_c0_g1_i1.p1 TRINITY_DN92128_c0_g1~~TRINITY_DN92128_c0_g1_i1.p1  ORF type:complete len:747 (-),score=114.31 TRINITY_DN92128_c0_g1_i1:179-2383(-)
MAQIDKRRSSRLKSALLDGRCGFSPKLEGVGPDCEQQCGACLLELDTASADGEFVAVLDRCQPLHFFHVGCIATWAELENSCPLCKHRFSKIGVYDAQGTLLRVTYTEERDQNFETAEDDDDDDSVCYVCHKADNESALLLCDGQGGRCKASAHYYCVKLESVPEEDWFCADCAGSQGAPPSAGQQQPDSLPKESSQESTVVPSTDDSQQSLTKESSQEASSSSCPAGTARVQAKPELPSDQEDLRSLHKAEKSDTVKCGATKSRVSGSSKPKPDTNSDLTPIKREAVEALASSDRRSFKWRKTQGVPSGSDNAAQADTNSAVKLEKLESTAASPSDTIVASDNSSLKIPTWISRKGSRVTVDLGGRRIKDPAASVLAQVMKQSLEQIQASSSNIVVSLHLAGNKLQKSGIASFLKALEQTGLPLARLDLERNRLDSTAGMWLAAWLSRQTRGPPEELLLSLNSGLGDAALKALLESLGVKITASNISIPVWVEASFTGLKDIDSLLESLSAQVPFCFALDRSVCGPSKCSSCADDRRALLHLHGVLEQRFNDTEDLAPEQKTLHGFPRLAATKISRSSAAVDQHPTERASHAPLIDTKAGIRSSTAVTQHNEGLSVGKGTLLRASRTTSSEFSRGSSESVVPSNVQEADEREARRSWAASLGKRGGGDDESQDISLGDYTPNCGMWDCVRAEEKRRKLEKQKQLRAAKRANATASSPKNPSSESLGSFFQTSR